MTTFVTSQMAGVNFAANDTTPAFTPGTMCYASDGSIAMYVPATSTIGQYNFCIIINTSSAAGASVGCVPVTTTNALTSQRLAVAQVAITGPVAGVGAVQYGWVFLSGNNLQGNYLGQPAAPVYTTATAGLLSDTKVTAGYCLGVVAMTSAASASTVPVVMGFSVIRTWGGA